MIPAELGYVRPAGIAQAVRLLGPGSRVLAGGQSLVPALKLHRSPPVTLVDIARIPALRSVSEVGGELLIGAAVTYDDLHHHPLVRAHCPVLARLGGRVADPQVRNRGTLAGSLSHADPAGDAPAVLLALGAHIEVRSSAGERTLDIDGFFQGPHRTVLGPGDLVTGIRVPKLGPGWAAHYEKFTRVSHMWAVLGACALIHRDAGTVLAARIALSNAGPAPLRATATEDALLSGAAVGEAAAFAADGTDPASDVHASADFRRHLARVVTARAIGATA